MGCVGMDSRFAVEQTAAADWSMLVAASADGHHPSQSVSKLRVLRMVGRRGLPTLIEATVIPSVLFYVFFVTVGAPPAMIAALLWTYGSMFRRIVRSLAKEADLLDRVQLGVVKCNTLVFLNNLIQAA